MKINLPNRPVSRVFIHCTASELPLHGCRLVDEIRRWHVEGNGWSDIGYHYVIDKGGMIMPGRDLSLIPAAQYGNNTGTIAIVVHGLVEFTSSSMNSLRYLCNSINEADSSITFHGHCEVSTKSCPVFPYKKELNLDNNGKLNGGFYD